MLEKKTTFDWPLIEADWKDKMTKKLFFTFLHKLWTYFNQTNNFKQAGLFSQKYML